MSQQKKESGTLSEIDVRYYISGFLRVLRRYRLMTMVGWLIVTVGFIGLLLAWSMDLPHGLIDLVLAALTILSGILLVQQSVAALQEYVSVPVPQGEPVSGVALEVAPIMEEIRRGGWREASGAIRKVEAIAAAGGLAGQAGYVSQLFQE